MVLGEGITALAVVRSLGRAGLEPFIVCPPRDLAARSRWVMRRVINPGSELDGSNLPPLSSLLEPKGVFRAVVIPCSDMWSAEVARLPPDVAQRYVSSTPPTEVLDLLVDKWLFAETLSRLALPHPRTTLLRSADHLSEIPLDGLFLKPCNSQEFGRRFKRKGFTFENETEARRAFGLIEEAGLTAVLQEYIPGPPTEHVFVDGFIDREGTVCAIFARRRVRMFPPDFGNSSLTVSVAPAEVQAAIDSVLHLLRAIGYRGVFSAEFKHDPRDGLFKLLEVNSRPWWYIGFANHCGVDVSVMAYRDALGLPVTPVERYAEGERCVLISLDVRAFLQMRRHERLSTWSLVRSWRGAFRAVYSRDDPLPAVRTKLPSILRFRRSRVP